MYYLQKVLPRILLVLLLLIISQVLTISANNIYEYNRIEIQIDSLISQQKPFESNLDTLKKRFFEVNKVIKKNTKRIQKIEDNKMYDYILAILIALFSAFIGAYFSFKFSKKIEGKNYSNLFHNDINRIISATNDFDSLLNSSFKIINNNFHTNYSIKGLNFDEIIRVIENITNKTEIERNQLSHIEFLEFEKKSNLKKLKQIKINYPEIKLLIDTEIFINKYKSNFYISTYNQKIIVKIENSLIDNIISIDLIKKYLNLLK